MDFTSLKHRLDNREKIELHSEDDFAIIGKSKVTNAYVFIFNTQALFALKRFDRFVKRMQEKVDQYNLVEIEANE